MIAITFALPAESSGIVNRLELQPVTREAGGNPVFGKIGGRDVAIFHTGVGRNRCRQTIEPFLQTIRPRVLISSGFAGSLADQVDVGDVIVGENVSDPAV